MSLDDILRTRARYEEHYGAPRGRGWSHGPGHKRRALFHDLIRANQYPVLPIFNGIKQELKPSGIPDTDGTKLYLSNLDYDVTNTDIQLLFSEVGDLKSSSIHYNGSGRSKGTAVVFHHQTDALAAIKRYNNVRLDGKPLKIDLVRVNLVTPAPVPPVNLGRSASPPVNFGRPRPLPVNMGRPTSIDSSGNIILRRAINVASGSIQEKVGARESLHGGAGHGFAWNREQQGPSADKLTFANLDADLGKYRLEALKKK